MGYESMKGPKLIKGGPKWAMWSRTAYVVVCRRPFLMYIQVGILNGWAILDLLITSHAIEWIWALLLCLGMSKGRAGPRVVLTLPSIYARLGLGGPKPSEGLDYLGSYPILKGQGRAQGLKKRKSLLFFTLLPSIEYQLRGILSNFYCQWITNKIFTEQKLFLKTFLYWITLQML